MTTSYVFVAGYTKGGIATTPSSAPTVTIVDSNNNVLVAGATATTALSNLTGVYLYSYSGSDNFNLFCVFSYIRYFDGSAGFGKLYACSDLCKFRN